MRKINDNTYVYRGIQIQKLSNGNYVGEVLVPGETFPRKVTGATQAGFIRMYKYIMQEVK